VNGSIKSLKIVTCLFPPFGGAGREP
jgi:hypothetical protein